MASLSKLSTVAKRWSAACHELATCKPRYWFGGEDPMLGIDCSGLVAYVLGRAGWPNTSRLAADAYMDGVFKLRKPEAALGDYAQMFCAYGLKEANGDFSHIILPYVNSLIIESTTAPRNGVFPGKVLALGSEYQSYVNTRSNRPLGEDLDSSFWDFAELIASVYLNREYIGDSLTRPEFWGTFTNVTGGAKLPRTQDSIAAIFTWQWDLDAMVEITALLYGRDRRLIREELYTLMSSGYTVDSPYAMTHNRVSGFMEFLARANLRIGASRFRFSDAWMHFVNQIGREDLVDPFSSGVRIRDRQSLVVGNGTHQYTQGFLSSAQIDTFLESESYSLPLETAMDRTQRVPVILP